MVQDSQFLHVCVISSTHIHLQEGPVLDTLSRNMPCFQVPCALGRGINPKTSSLIRIRRGIYLSMLVSEDSKMYRIPSYTGCYAPLIIDLVLFRSFLLTDVAQLLDI